MVRTGIITGREITTNRDGTNQRVMLQVQMSNPDDIQTVEYVSLPGQDENPINGSRVYIIEVANSYKIGIAVDDGVDPWGDPGEKRVYSTDAAGAIQAFINLLKTGIIEINGNADFAVRFTALETQMQLMVTAINAAFATKLNGAGAAGGIVLDLSTAKVAEVKLP